ncbi:hypothetical protein [Streptomyces thermolilacinus]|uniref:hypothetical protein n=1 Tax=Streptomyces thermolilacinus TaxID=285540 RepID=UPI0033C84032
MELTCTGDLPLACRVWIDACEDLFRRAVEDGDTVPTVAPQVVAYLVVSSLAGIQMVSSVLPGRSDLISTGGWTRCGRCSSAGALPGLVPPDRRRKVTGLLDAAHRDPA